MSDVFISYSRKDLQFVSHLVKSLKASGLDVWLDKEDIPLSAEWWQEICRGIEGASNFTAVITPNFVQSEVCYREVEYALQKNKRFVPIVHAELIEQADRKALHPRLNDFNWVFIRPTDPFDKAVKQYVAALNADLDYIRAHTRLLVRAEEWKSKNRNTSFVLRGDELREAENWLTNSVSKEPLPTALHTEYIVASRKAAHTRRRVIVGAGGLGLMIIAILVLAAFVLFQVSETRRSLNRSRELAAQALNLLESNRLDLALLLGVEASRTADTLESRNSLLTGLQHPLRMVSYLRGHSDWVSELAFSPDGQLLASAGMDGTIILWSMLTFQPIWQIDLELAYWNSLVMRLAFTADGTVLMSRERDNTIRLWQAASGQPIGQPYTSFPAEFTLNDQSVTIIPCDELGAGIACSPDEIVLWNNETRDILGRLIPAPRFSGDSQARSPDGSLLAAIDFGGTFTLRDVPTGELVVHPVPAYTSTVENPGIWVPLVYSPTTPILASGGCALDRERFACTQGEIRLWDVSGQPSLGHTFSDHAEGEYGAFLVAFSSDGRTLVSVGDDKRLVVRGITGEQPGEWSIVDDLHDSRHTRILVLSPTGRILAWPRCVEHDPQYPSLCRHTEIQLWELGNHQPSHPTISVGNNVWQLAFSPDGRLLAGSIDDDTILLWDVFTGQPLGAPLSGHTLTPYSLAFSPDGKILVSGGCGDTIRGAYGCSPGEIRFWDLATHQLIGQPLHNHDSDVWSLAFSPGGKILASGSADFTIVLWDVAARQPLGQPLVGHTNWVTGLAFSPDGRLLASTGNDRTVRLWDVATGQPLGRPLAGTHGTFSPDNHWLALVNPNGGVAVLDVSLESWRTRACRIANRNLTSEEWGRFFGDEPYRQTCPQPATN